jgi:hypothetical protein
VDLELFLQPAMEKHKNNIPANATIGRFDSKILNAFFIGFEFYLSIRKTGIYVNRILVRGNAFIK